MYTVGMGLESDFRRQFRLARESLAEVPAPTRDGRTEYAFERQVFETAPIGLLEDFVVQLAKEVDELRATVRGGDGNGEMPTRGRD
jgi:hypothetical protein